jgi:hypothetical protein
MEPGGGRLVAAPEIRFDDHTVAHLALGGDRRWEALREVLG